MMSRTQISEDDVNTIKKIIKPLLGLLAWDVKLGIGSFITMEFGNSIPDAHGKRYGEWNLWIYCCGWYLENPGETFLGSEDPRELLKQGITVLEGRRLEDIVISPKAFETDLIFNDGFVLHTFPLNFMDSYSDYWKLFTPEGKVLVIGPAPKWYYSLSSKPVNRE